MRVDRSNKMDWKLTPADKKRLLTVPKRRWTIGRCTDLLRRMWEEIASALILAGLVWAAIVIFFWPVGG